MLTPYHHFRLIFFLCLLLGAAGGTIRAAADEPNQLEPMSDMPPFIAAPRDPGQWPQWREDLKSWRRQSRRRLAYQDTLYQHSAVAWARHIFSCYYLMLWDERFLDPTAGVFRPETLLQQLERDFGPLDALIVWHGYPNLGFDARSQFDMYRALPGGQKRLRDLSRQLHGRGIRFFICYNPWDIAASRTSEDNLEELVRFACSVEADAVFLDTMMQSPQGLLEQLHACRPEMVLQSELPLPLEAVATHHMSWAQWLVSPDSLGILRNRWFEPRHTMFLINRWDTDHTAELHAAWLNGAGVIIWENVFGSWNGWNERDRALLRTMRPVQRCLAEWFTEGEWTPFAPTCHPDILASAWRRPEGTLWTLVNRSVQAYAGPLLTVSVGTGVTCYDLIARVAAQSEPAPSGQIIFGQLPPHGVGALALLSDTAAPNVLARLRAHPQPAGSLHSDPNALRPVISSRQSLPRSSAVVSAVPPGMVAFPAADYACTITYRLRECGLYEYAPLARSRYPVLHTPQTVTHRITLKPFAIDLKPVTNRQFQVFLKQSGYCPTRRENFLKHWVNEQPPVGQEDQPVVYVSLSDAIAYANFFGKRICSEYEWEYACEAGPLEFGNPRVWNWTEGVYADGRTRFCILKGGSFFKAEGSEWYADGGPQPCSFSAKYILTWPGLDRCATIGFRCAADLTVETGK